MPTGSSPLVGSSRMSNGGLPIRAPASPSRCFMPREYFFANRLRNSTRTARGLNQAQKHLHRGAFPCSIGAEKTIHLALWNVQTDFVHRDKISICLGEAVGFNPIAHLYLSFPAFPYSILPQPDASLPATLHLPYFCAVSLDSVYMRLSQNSQPNSDTPDMNSRKER